MLAQTPAAAAAAPAFTISGNVTLASDYLWRGLSQSWGKPALQAGLTGSSKGSQNLELSGTFEVAEGLTLKGVAGRQTMPTASTWPGPTRPWQPPRPWPTTGAPA